MTVIGNPVLRVLNAVAAITLQDFVRHLVGLLSLNDDGKAIALEIKPEKGGVLSDSQSGFLQRWLTAGGLTTCSFGLDYALEILKSWDWLK
jgi:hypothetical protein